MVIFKALLYVYKCGDYVPQKESKLFLNPLNRELDSLYGRELLTAELKNC